MQSKHEGLLNDDGPACFILRFYVPWLNECECASQLKVVILKIWYT